MYLLHDKGFLDCKTKNDKQIHQHELDRIHTKLKEMFDFNCMFITIEGDFSLSGKNDKVINAPMRKLFDLIYSSRYDGFDYACYDDVLVLMMYKLLNDNNYARTQVAILPYGFDEDYDKVIMTIGKEFSTPYEQQLMNEYLNNLL
ncbi:MAG: hypothetical protein LUG60_15270 [Erysipelotrichaceae bacterium]|nr:hypothetical protein [Erysipelotrichaceae bacterium]